MIINSIWPFIFIWTVICKPFSFFFRLEYEQKRDMESRIRKLESSLAALENDLKQVQKKEAQIKLASDKATDEINKWKEEMKGNLVLYFLI